MDSGQLTTNTNTTNGKESEENTDESSSSSQEDQRYFYIRKNSKFMLEDLIRVEPGTLFLAEEDGVGKEINMTPFGPSFSVPIGFQFFPSDFIRQYNFFSLSRRDKSFNDICGWILSRDISLRTNWLSYAGIRLDFEVKHKNKEESIGLFLGDLIVGSYSTADTVVLMKTLMDDGIGWVCFLRNRLDEVFLELQ